MAPKHRGAPPGNQRAARGTRWRDEINLALDQGKFGSIRQGLALRALAAKLIERALEGDLTAIKELGDRLDGKAHQAIAISGGEDERPVSLVIKGS